MWEINYLWVLDSWTAKTHNVKEVVMSIFPYYFLTFWGLNILNSFLIFKCSQKWKNLLKVRAFYQQNFEGIVWISEIMPNKKTCVMELQCSLECPCWPAFVCNYCLIKHAGQLPGSDWLATDTQLYTECLQPPSQVFALLSGPLQKNCD